MSERIAAAQDAGESCQCAYCVTTSVNFHAEARLEAVTSPKPHSLDYWNESRREVA